MASVKTFEIKDLIVKDEYLIRGLHEDAILRYMDLFEAGKEKPIKVQKDTNIVIDGIHRLEAAKRLGREKIKGNYLDIENREIRSKAYKHNHSHGVPLNKDERNQLITDLYNKDGKSQHQIAKLIGLDQSRVSQIINDMNIHNSNNGANNDNRVKKEVPNNILARLLLNGENQADIALKFDVSQGTISNKWSKFRDNVNTLYTEKKLTKNEISQNVELSPEEIDLILQGYEDPLNFEQQTSTWWPEFGLDDRFGQEHGSNLPADLVRNVLALFTKPGDVILDPAAGGGVVLDVCQDMVNRKCYAYDLTPSRDDIKTHNLLNGAPSCPETPDFIFFDPPYWQVKKGAYSSDNENDLANVDYETFIKKLSEIFGYWDSGRLAVLMSSSRVKKRFIDLPFEIEKLMVENGWKIIEHIVNNSGRIPSETGANISSAKEYRWILRKHIHIIVGEKP